MKKYRLWYHSVKFYNKEEVGSNITLETLFEFMVTTKFFKYSKYCIYIADNIDSKFFLSYADLKVLKVSNPVGAYTYVCMYISAFQNI